MTESEVVNEWIRQGMAKGKPKVARQSVLTVLTIRFPGAVTAEITRLINEQDSLPVLDAWFQAALRAYIFDHFLDAMKK
jgi:hypothetical protein